VRLDIARDLKFHELMRLADPKAQLPDQQAEALIADINRLPMLSQGLTSLICLLTIFGSLR
jgi:hypothetical protein